MAFFKFIARDRLGNLKEDTVEAVSKEDLVNSLQESGFYIISIGQAAGAKHYSGRKISHYRGLRSSDLIIFARELAVLLGAGVTIIKSLDVLTNQVRSIKLLNALSTIKKDVEGGYTFQNALKKHRNIFSDFWIHLVETGEASGHLPASLNRLAEYLESAEALKKKIISALVYPIILVTVSMAALTIFFLKVVPVFDEIFASFKVDLPVLTRIVIMVSEIIKRYFLLIAAIVTIAAIAISRLVKTEKGGYYFDQTLLKIPVVGTLVEGVAVERFTSGLSMLIKSGVPILHALEISENIIGNKVMEKELRLIKAAVRDGKGMSEVMGKAAIFPPLVVQMIGVGEEIGELGQMLERISVFYKERIQTFVDRLATMFEPIVLVFMGFVIGILLISMFLPIINLSSIIKAS
ncbi:MAG: type II secretion system F family protein [Candidatus Omnitrophota bacterium]